jgi:transposase InsO family protein
MFNRYKDTKTKRSAQVHTLLKPARKALQEQYRLTGHRQSNACVESFFGSLKVEAIQYEPIMDRETMRQAMFEYIEVGYNRTRRHSALGYLSPEDFESQHVA